MKYLVLLLAFMMLVSCVPTAQVVASDPIEPLVGYVSYGPIIQKVIDARKAACEGVEGCVPADLTEQDVLGIITSVTRQVEAEGATVVGIESKEFRIWFQK